MAERARVALQLLREAESHLREYQNDTWESIDPRNMAQRNTIIAQYDAIDAHLADLNALIGSFDQLLSSQISGEAAVVPTNADDDLPASAVRGENTSKQPRGMSRVALDRGVPYDLRENFTGVKTWGFEFEGVVETGLTQMIDIYIRLCQLIERRYPGKLEELGATMLRTTGAPLIGRDPSRMLDATDIGGGLYIDAKIGNDYKAQNLRRMLRHLGLPLSSIHIFLDCGPTRLVRIGTEP